MALRFMRPEVAGCDFNGPAGLQFPSRCLVNAGTALPFAIAFTTPLNAAAFSLLPANNSRSLTASPG